MRIASMLVATSLLLFLPGCSDDGGSDEPTVTGGSSAVVKAAPPANISVAEDVLISADPSNFAMLGICAFPLAQCFNYEFTVNETLGPDGEPVDENNTVQFAASLSWGLLLNDFDMYLYQGDTDLALGGASDVTAGPGAEEAMSAELEPGDYTIVVVGWLVVSDGFALEATFE